MVKENGIGMAVSVDNSASALKDISADIRSLDFSTPRGVIASSGLGTVGMERILGLADMSVTLSGVFDDATDLIHEVFKTVSTTSVTRTFTMAHSGQTMSEEVIATDYQISNADDRDLAFTVPLLLNDSGAPTWS